MEESERNSDDFVFYGTAVEQLESDETISKKPVPIQEQIATDEKGRRRFHGAFTGGFSAGYFNTVGSIEGWAPRTFQSSRQSKNEFREQRPEDYMDTEDFAEHGIAPKKILTTDAFSSKSGREYGVANLETPLTDLVAPLRESYGIVLLKEMGWKPGQGIGPRITQREKYLRSAKDGLKVHGSLEDAMEIDRRAGFKLFAPNDVPLVKLDAKSNYHGIGYKGLHSSSAILSTSSKHFSLFDAPESDRRITVAAPTLSSKRKKQGMTGQAFGVGAFEDEDDDVYFNDDLSRYDRVLGEPEKQREKRNDLKAIEGSGAARVLEGFEKSAAPLGISKVYLPPEIPSSFHGLHISHRQDAAIPEPKAPEKYTTGFRPHDAISRSEILTGSKPKTSNDVASVFDLIPANQKNRIPIFQKESADTKPEISKPTLIKTAQQNPANSASVEEQRRIKTPQQNPANSASVEEQRRIKTPQQNPANSASV